VRSTLFALPVLLLASLLVAAQEPVATPAAPAKAPVVILKMDDLTARGAKAGEGVSPRWEAFAKACEELDVKASMGIIGNALEAPSPEFVAWVQQKNTSGRFQMWNHGFTHAEQPKENGQRRAEFIGSDAATQKATLERTQRLAKEKLGITLTAFGSPFNVQDANTEVAMAEVPEIDTWFFGPAKRKGGKQVILPRVANLEHPTMKPSSAGLIKDFEKNGRGAEVLVLQGHPNGWSPEQLEEFRKAVRYLKGQGCEFLTPAEYVARRNSRS
jgi:peptidoglycan/xylan/chitin deacetylase (PgdA/CDA1 family)